MKQRTRTTGQISVRKEAGDTRPAAKTRERGWGTGAPANKGPSRDAQRIALTAAEAALDKKAAEVEIVDVTGKVDYADFLVLTTGTSDRHVAAIAESIDQALGKKGWHSISVEGLPRGEWVLLDYVDVVVHVFQERTRALYDLDGLWMDARRVRVPDRPSPSA